MKIEGSRILITGGARGLGRRFALDLAQAGARVGVCATSEERLRAFAEEARAQGLEIWTHRADVASESDVVELFDAFVGHFGGIDVLVANAGITRDALVVKKKDGTVQTMPTAYWREVLDVNLTGVFLCGREAAKRMVEQGTGGVIVPISSVNRAGAIGQTNYSATKAGLDAMTVVWAKELVRYGIRVAALAPGYVATDMTAQMREDVLKKIEAMIPLGRLARPEEISHALKFILENDYVHGRVIEVDGGLRI
ncbi:SDR family NAD(P)-dependent oxidoreductase [Deferrisoma palaeochoriense]